MRVFTPASARQTLEAIRPAAEAMSRVFRSMEVIRPAEIVSDRRVEPDYFFMVKALRESMEALLSAGVQVKDIRSGLLDFPARRAGRLVLLCWKVGEAGLGFWHEAEAGYAGRQPVDEDGPWEETEEITHGVG